MKISSLCQHVAARLAAIAIIALVCCTAKAQEKTAEAKKDGKAVEVYPLAVLPFQERGREVSDMGKQVSDLLFANLIVEPELYLVEREELGKILDEQKLSVAGVINPDTATRLGQLTGAKILVSGSVMEVSDKVYLVAKVIGTETSRVLGASVKGNAGEDLGKLVEKLSADVNSTITEKANLLVAEKESKQDRLASLRKRLGKKKENAKRPTVFVEIAERHVGQATLDPAAQTEIVFMLKELGFEVIDSEQGSKSDAEILIVGEGMSEHAARVGDLHSVKARLEVKAINRESGKVLAMGRQVTIEIDATEQIAGKSALQECAATIAEQILPKIAGSSLKGKKK